MTSRYSRSMDFESDVRSTAEAVWGLEPGECQPEHYSDNIIIRELDGIAVLRDVTHLIMATTSTKLEKIKSDVRKLNEAEKIERKRGNPVKKWLITNTQLDAQHIAHARKNDVTVIKLHEFSRRFFDGRDYISRRRNCAFGSVRNLENGTITVGEKEYVELPYHLIKIKSIKRSQEKRIIGRISLTKIKESLQNGDTVVLQGPFGAGKSLTVKELFLHLSSDYLKDKAERVPIVINLREHWGQDFSDEILDRHARSIGFPRREDLVAAWRAGNTILLIDGFDEVASPVLASSDSANYLKDTRNKALSGVRELVSMSPGGCGVLVAGRDHYFDGIVEMIHTLGLTGRSICLIDVLEFEEQTAVRYLESKGYTIELPDWLPRKPLFLGYLAHNNLLEQALLIDSAKGYGFVWDSFIDLICERESLLNRASMDPQTVRAVLERLACKVRQTYSGTGPITSATLAESYKQETKLDPNEGVLLQLQRLPGLTERDQQPGHRSFIDTNLLEALQGSGFARMLLESGYRQLNEKILSHLSPGAISIAAYKMEQRSSDISTIIAQAMNFSNREHADFCMQLAADSISVALELSSKKGSLDCKGISLSGVDIGTVDLEENSIENLQISNSLINEIILGSKAADSKVTVYNSIINKVCGVSSETGLPEAIFKSGNEVVEFDNMDTNSAILQLDIPWQLKALLSVLRKLYRQAGTGRQRNSLKRGLPQGKIRDCIDDVIRILQTEKIIHVFNEIVYPIRGQSGRVSEIIDAPVVSKDPVVVKVKKLK